MASEKKINTILKEAGYTPKEGRAIIVTYAPANLSEQISRFFFNEFFVLQMCEDSLVLMPFGKASLALKKEVALEIPYNRIHNVEVSENLLNYYISLDTDDGLITLSAQQKELSAFRTSGTLTFGMAGVEGEESVKVSNWHHANLDATLKSLKALA